MHIACIVEHTAAEWIRIWSAGVRECGFVRAQRQSKCRHRGKDALVHTLIQYTQQTTQ